MNVYFVMCLFKNNRIVDFYVNQDDKSLLLWTINNNLEIPFANSSQ